MYIYIFSVAAGIFATWLFPKFWKYIKKKLFGKNISILGDSQTGKTTLQTYLRSGKIPIKKVDKTGTKENLPDNYISMDEISFVISQGEDIGGEEIFFRNNWKEIFNKSDSCIYLIDISKVLQNDVEYLNRIKKHVKHLINWKRDLLESKKNFNLIFIGNFLDKILNLECVDENEIVKTKIKVFEILEKPIFNMDVNPSDFHIGSLKKDSFASELLKILLLQLSGLNNKIVNIILKYL